MRKIDERWVYIYNIYKKQNTIKNAWTNFYRLRPYKRGRLPLWFRGGEWGKIIYHFRNIAVHAWRTYLKPLHAPYNRRWWFFNYRHSLYVRRLEMVRELNVSRSTILYKLYALCLMMIRYVWNDTTTRTINININIILYTQSSLNYIKCISLFIIVGNFDVSTNGNPARWCGKTLAERKERKKKTYRGFFFIIITIFSLEKINTKIG